MGHQAMYCYVVKSPEGEFSEKRSIFSKVKNFQNPPCYILEKKIENYDKRHVFGYHEGLI